MFDFAWTEIALIGVVALVLIGPKDMPVAIKAITAIIKKARRMAAEFQTHVDDMVKDTELQDVRNSLRDIRSMDIRGAITRAVDKDGSIRGAMADPMRPPPPALPAAAVDDTMVIGDPLPEHTIVAPAAIPMVGAEMPAFVPPDEGILPAPAPVPAAREAPAFIPPETTPPDSQLRPHPEPASGPV